MIRITKPYTPAMVGMLAIRPNGRAYGRITRLVKRGLVHDMEVEHIDGTKSILAVSNHHAYYATDEQVKDYEALAPRAVRSTQQGLEIVSVKNLAEARLLVGRKVQRGPGFSRPNGDRQLPEGEVGVIRSVTEDSYLWAQIEWGRGGTSNAYEIDQGQSQLAFVPILPPLPHLDHEKFKRLMAEKPIMIPDSMMPSIMQDFRNP